MSATLLQRTSGILTAAGLTSGYKVRYFKWTDANGPERTMLFRLTGTEGGATTSEVQYPDVQVMLIGESELVTVALMERAREILAFVRTSDQIDDTLIAEPLGTLQGPYDLEDGRPWCKIDLRMMVCDH